MVSWIKRLCRRRSRVVPARPITPGQVAASSALVRSQSARRLAEGLQPQVTAAAAALRAVRQRNHFAEMIELTFREGRQ